MDKSRTANRYVPVDRKGPGQLLRHISDPKRWQVRAFVGRDGNGKRKYVSDTIYGGKRDAEARLAELLQQKNTGTLMPRSKMVLRDLADAWIEHKKRDVAPRTLTNYARSFALYILPSLGHLKLADIRLEHIDQLYGRMLTGDLPRPDGKTGVTDRPLSSGTVKQVHAPLVQALSQAVKWGYIRYNPAKEATVPSQRSKPKDWLDGAERVRFIEACRDSFYGAFYRLLVDTGLRPGEACALRWHDLDFTRSNRGVIAVRRAVTRDGDGNPVLAEPKTQKSRRTVPMLDGVRDVLLRHRDWQRNHGLSESGYVFTNHEGRMLRPWTFTIRDLERTLDAAGISKPLTLYGLRHTFATRHVAAGTPIKVVSDLLGHANIHQTANTYMHADPGVTSDWMERFEISMATEELAGSGAQPAN
ncbi:site-specific integrase [soil metagenome]